MRYSGRFVDENAQDRFVSAALKLKINELITLALDDSLGQLSDAIPLDSLAHINKKVGRDAHSEKRTTLSIGAVSA